MGWPLKKRPSKAEVSPESGNTVRRASDIDAAWSAIRAIRAQVQRLDDRLDAVEHRLSRERMREVRAGRGQPADAAPSLGIDPALYNQLMSPWTR